MKVWILVHICTKLFLCQIGCQNVNKKHNVFVKGDLMLWYMGTRQHSSAYSHRQSCHINQFYRVPRLWTLVTPSLINQRYFIFISYLFHIYLTLSKQLNTYKPFIRQLFIVKLQLIFIKLIMVNKHYVFHLQTLFGWPLLSWNRASRTCTTF